MSQILVALLLSSFFQQSFSKFSYCRENSRGPYELQCVDLDGSGKGQANLKRRDADAVRVDIQLSPAAQGRYSAVIMATNYLEQGSSYESDRKVADLGKKRLAIDLPDGRREATFNYSTRKDVTDLMAFFDALINQQTLMLDIATAMQFDRLSLPKRLEQVERELQAGRIGDPEALIPTLEKIEADTRLVNFARTRAGKIKDQIRNKK
jgi:hypothetical protein